MEFQIQVDDSIRYLRLFQESHRVLALSRRVLLSR